MSKQKKPPTTADRIKQGLKYSLADARKALKLTQEDAADRIGISGEFYARIERGNAIPSVQTLVVMSDALGVSPDALLGYKPLSDPNPSAAPDEPSEVRLAIRRVRSGSPRAVRFVNMLLKEFARVDDE
ncbi:MAG: hypothetical protein Tsb0020_34980 [Haliangiales bacterium]